MKKISEQEARNIEGGYAVECTRCGARKSGLLMAGVSAFALKHRITCGKGKVIFSTIDHAIGYSRLGCKWYD